MSAGNLTGILRRMEPEQVTVKIKVGTYGLTRANNSGRTTKMTDQEWIRIHSATRLKPDGKLFVPEFLDKR